MRPNDIAINREQQMNFHNARCYFLQFKDKYSEIFGKEVLRDFNKAMNYLISAHDPVRALEDKRSEDRFEHYEAMRKHYGLSAVWSMMEYDRLDDNTDKDIKTIKYYDVIVPVVKRPEHPWLRWTDVYEACDKAIKESGDEHHIFIEYLHREDSDPEGQYKLSTGS
jgi:hypothetical protein